MASALNVIHTENDRHNDTYTKHVHKVFTYIIYLSLALFP